MVTPFKVTASIFEQRAKYVYSNSRDKLRLLKKILPLKLHVSLTLLPIFEEVKANIPDFATTAVALVAKSRVLDLLR